MRKTLAARTPFFRPSRRKIAVRKISDTSFEMGRAVGRTEGDAAGYARCLRERSGLGAIARQRRAPEPETALA